jgi:NADH:ubiquinone oxidoreductase subunit E
MKITVCIGSSCHLKGSRPVIEAFQKQITERGLMEKVELCGAFCMKNCQTGVCVSVDGTVFSVTPETANSFFVQEVLPRL